jgi:hypothetical protein
MGFQYETKCLSVEKNVMMLLNIHSTRNVEKIVFDKKNYNKSVYKYIFLWKKAVDTENT